jgi:hypothetical protein
MYNTDRVAFQAAKELSVDANSGATYLSQQIQWMQQNGESRHAQELVAKTQAYEERMPKSPMAGYVNTSEVRSPNGWFYENVQVNGSMIAQIPERPVGCRPGAPFPAGVVLPEIVIGIGLGGEHHPHLPVPFRLHVPLPLVHERRWP